MKIKFIGFNDDWMAPRQSVEAMKNFYCNTNNTSEYFSPNHLQRKKIGHFGFFKRSINKKLWANSLIWLDELLSD